MGSGSQLRKDSCILHPDAFLCFRRDQGQRRQHVPAQARKNAYSDIPQGHIRATHAVDKASLFLCLTAVQQSSSLEYKVSMCFLPWEALLMFSGLIYDSAAIEF